MARPMSPGVLVFLSVLVLFVDAKPKAKKKGGAKSAAAGGAGPAGGMNNGMNGMNGMNGGMMMGQMAGGMNPMMAGNPMANPMAPGPGQVGPMGQMPGGVPPVPAPPPQITLNLSGFQAAEDFEYDHRHHRGPPGDYDRHGSPSHHRSPPYDRDYRHHSYGREHGHRYDYEDYPLPPYESHHHRY